MDRLTSLTIFNHVAESGGFSAAARRLDMSVTMVSNHIAALEEQLGVRLLNRTTRKVSLTEIGKAYYDRSRQILLELDEADAMAGAAQSTPQGTLRLYTTTQLVRFLAPVVGEFLAAHPAVSVDLKIGAPWVDPIAERLDLAIHTQNPPDSSLIVRRLTPWRHYLCGAPAYLKAHGVPEKPADLSRHNCLRYALFPFGEDWRFEDKAGATHTVRIAGNVVTNSGDALRYLALNGHGLLLAPSFLVGDDINRGRLVHLMRDYTPRSSRSTPSTRTGTISRQKCAASSTCWPPASPRIANG